MRTRFNNLELLAPLSDEEVAARVAEGDPGAFELLMRRHNERLFRTARAVLSNDADAQDALQDAYMRIFKGLGGFSERSALVTWMTRIAFNEALRYRERRARIRRREQNDGRGEKTNTRATVPDPAMDEIERMRVFDKALAGLSDSERGVVMLRLVQGLSNRETAASLGMSESNVKVTLFRARPKMAAAFEGPGLDDIRRRLSFDGERCDRLVEATFRRIEQRELDA